MDNGNNISIKQGNRIKTKASWFNGATHCPADIENIKENISEFPFYAWIIHESDKDTEGLHLHFLVNIRGSRTIKSMAESLGCDYGVVQKTDLPNKYARYMLHIGCSDKKQYSMNDIHCNNIDRFAYFISGSVASSSDIYSDFNSLKNGRISREEFVEKYKGELSNLNFYQKIRIFSEIDRIAKY